MALIDYFLFGFYMLGILGIGTYFFRKNQSIEDYYVGGRSIKAGHIGLSIVATDVGGGFSIGLGGVGFVMGLSGSWLLFTGLIGAWLSAVFVIPHIKGLDSKYKMLTYPDFLRYRYNSNIAMVAAVISGVGYLGFAGAKLASATIFYDKQLPLEPMTFSLLFIGIVTIVYTVIGGLKAVIYTDTIQWILLLGGLTLVTIPMVLIEIGGWQGLRAALPDKHFSLANITPVTFVNWMVTIIPIWLVGMTLYQRMYACKGVTEAKRAWIIAGVFEYPIMAFTGVFLGMCARVLFPESDPEMAIPLVIRETLPYGVTGIVIAAYFSAIMSTADSCMMASSGNFVNDLIERYWLKKLTTRQSVKLSMLTTFLIGGLALLLAARSNTVLDAILMSYSFMVSGLFIPTLGAYFWKKGSSAGALTAMLGGGLLTLVLMLDVPVIPECMQQSGFDPSIYGIILSIVLYVGVSLLFPEQQAVASKKPSMS